VVLKSLHMSETGLEPASSLGAISEDSDGSFSSKVKRQNSKKVFRGAKNLLRCYNCDSTFETARDLKKHRRNCHNAGSRHIRASRAGHICCRVCCSNFKSRDQLNVHIFYEHSDEECVSKYNRLVEDVIGARATERLRPKLAK
jgi:hypothetical protein